MLSPILWYWRCHSFAFSCQHAIFFWSLYGPAGIVQYICVWIPLPHHYTCPTPQTPATTEDHRLSMAESTWPTLKCILTYNLVSWLLSKLMIKLLEKSWLFWLVISKYDGTMPLHKLMLTYHQLDHKEQHLMKLKSKSKVMASFPGSQWFYDTFTDWWDHSKWRSKSHEISRHFQYWMSLSVWTGMGQEPSDLYTSGRSIFPWPCCIV